MNKKAIGLLESRSPAIPNAKFVKGGEIDDPTKNTQVPQRDPFLERLQAFKDLKTQLNNGTKVAVILAGIERHTDADLKHDLHDHCWSILKNRRKDEIKCNDEIDQLLDQQLVKLLETNRTVNGTV